MRRTKKLRILICISLIMLLFSFSITKVQAQREMEEAVSGIFYVDTQYQCKKFEGPSIFISGWIMTNCRDSNMKIYIDGKEAKVEWNTRTARPDVLKAITGYGGAENNPLPGMEGILNISEWEDGPHMVTYQLEKANGDSLYSETYNVNFNKTARGTFDIDSPNIYKTTPTIKENFLPVQGWIMTNDTNAKMNIYIDGEKTDTMLTRTERPDVIAAIQGYGATKLNLKPGFETRIDLSMLQQGVHEIIYRLQTEEGKVLEEKSKPIYIQKGEFYIDTQEKKKTFEGPSVFISGWWMSSDKQANMKILIDGEDTQTELSRKIQRPDVLKAITGYGGSKTNPNPGFEGILDISKYTNGEHTITYLLLQENGMIMTSQDYKVIFHKEAKGTFDIDTPNPYKKTTNIKEEVLQIQGWMMTNDASATITIQIDGQPINVTMGKKTERPDVLATIQNYDKNINRLPGFTMKVDLSSFTAGEHEIVYQMKAKDGTILEEKNARINIQKAEFYIDTPISYTWEEETIPLKGWLMALDKKAKVKLFINEEEVTLQNYKRVERPDVLAAISGYGGKEYNPLPGFEAQIDISQYEKGQYNITYQIESEEGKILAQENKTITIDHTPKATLDIDLPNWKGVENIDGTITGWVMTNIKNPKIRVLIDDCESWGNETRVERPDVLAAIDGYGGKENNPLPGFMIQIKYGDFSIGMHTLKIVITDEEGNEIASKTREFPIVKSYELEKGRFGFSGLKVKGEWKGTDLTYYKIGDGPNVFFGTFSIHGFEDQWNYDGSELTAIAEAFKDRLVRDKDRNILSKWTIYIFPEVNPDGARHGWSNNGPGRQTLYSWAPGNAGIDMNRCWQIGSSYTKMTGRNYNGTQGFQAYEAGYLKDFLLSHKSTQGQTVLIDLHGWTTQLIGDYGICHECYAPQFSNNRYTGTYGTGYLINWARSSLGANGRPARSALIELPGEGIRNHQDVLNARYADRYIEGTLYMLRVLE